MNDSAVIRNQHMAP